MEAVMLRLLLDTNIILWLGQLDSRLPMAWRAAIDTRDNDVCVSIVS